MFGLNFFVLGDECESYWHCFEAYIIRNESASISPDMGFHFHCFGLYHHSNELFKQGNEWLPISFARICSLFDIFFLEGKRKQWEIDKSDSSFPHCVIIIKWLLKLE